jgi:hypothetical protein
MLDDSPISSQGSDGEVGRVIADSEDEEVVVLHSGHSSADDSEECEQMCCSSIVADSDFR